MTIALRPVQTRPLSRMIVLLLGVVSIISLSACSYDGPMSAASAPRPKAENRMPPTPPVPLPPPAPISMDPVVSPGAQVMQAPPVTTVVTSPDGKMVTKTTTTSVSTVESTSATSDGQPVPPRPLPTFSSLTLP